MKKLDIFGSLSTPEIKYISPYNMRPCLLPAAAMTPNCSDILQNRHMSIKYKNALDYY